jgi:hypothetical protein
VETENIYLVLGENVLPEPSGNTWNNYTWKSIEMSEFGVMPVITFITADGSDTLNNSNIIPNPAAISEPFIATFAENITVNEATFTSNNIIGVIGNNLTTTGEMGFFSSPNLEFADFPNAIIIEGSAFSGNSSLVSLNFPLVSIIESHAFNGCISLENVDFPLATTIGFATFQNCSSLVSLNFPLVESIEQNAFFDCVSLESIDFPLVTNIGASAFWNCSSLVSVSFGTGFEEQTEINFGYAVFTAYSSQDHLNTPINSDLILGKYVLPEPDLDAMTWQSGYGSMPQPYVWKSITIYSNIEENSIATHLIISPNPISSEAIISFGLLECAEITFEIFDILGNTYHTISNFYNTGDHFVPLYIIGIPDGSYIIRMLSKGKQIGTEKFVIAR